MTTHPATSDSSLTPILSFLRVSLHVMFAFLLLFAMIKIVLADDPQWAVLALAAALVVVYMVGTTAENRALHAQQRDIPRWQTVLWLILVVGLWGPLLLFSIDFVWLLFPLVFLILHILPTAIALACVAAAWALAAFVPRAIHPEDWGVANAVGPAIGVLFAVGVYFTYEALGREVARQEALTKELIAAQQQLAVTEHQSGRMEERERLSREIHDTVAQGLSSILLLSRAAKKSVAAGNESEALDQIATMEEQAGISLNEARRFVRDLASPDLGLPLDEAIIAHLERTEAKELSLGNPIDMVFTPLDPSQKQALAELPEPISRALYRVVGEAITNVVKHSHATKAVVTISMWDEEITVDIADNGRGLSHPKAENTVQRGFGLDGMRRRMEALGGSLAIECSTSGTIVTATVPLTSQGEHQ